MGIEPAGYYETLEDLRVRYGSVDIIKITDYAERNNITVKTVRRRYSLPKGTQMIEATTLARKICEIAAQK